VVRTHQPFLATIVARPHIGVVACGGPSRLHRTPVGLGNGAATREHGERHVSAVPKKEPYFLSPV
jgi:hypothetical protein